MREERIGSPELSERSEETARVVEAIAQLKPDERTALILLGLGCSYKEIAELRGWSHQGPPLRNGGASAGQESAGEGGQMLRPEPLALMEVLRPIEFNDALLRLQGMIGSEVKVIVNFYGRFFGCGFEGELDSVQTLPPDDTAVRLVFDAGAGLFLDPADVEAFLGGSAGSGPSWLELRLSFGATVTIESA